MQIVTDSGTDINLSSEEQKELNVHVVPLNVSLGDVTYKEGVDIRHAMCRGYKADLELRWRQVAALLEHAMEECSMVVHVAVFCIRQALHFL